MGREEGGGKREEGEGIHREEVREKGREEGAEKV
jgi:hypothetical protein